MTHQGLGDQVGLAAGVIAASDDDALDDPLAEVPAAADDVKVPPPGGATPSPDTEDGNDDPGT